MIRAVARSWGGSVSCRSRRPFQVRFVAATTTSTVAAVEEAAAAAAARVATVEANVASHSSGYCYLVSRRALEEQKQIQKQHLRHNNNNNSNIAAPFATLPPPPPTEAAWPRNVVWAFYAACSVLVPYSFAWFLSSHESWRSRLFPNSELLVVENDSNNNNNNHNSNTNKSPSVLVSAQSRLLQWMRQQFGEVDELAMSEPERALLLLRQWSSSHSGSSGSFSNSMNGSSSSSNSACEQIPFKFVDEPTAAVRRRQAQIEQQQSPNANVTVRLLLPSVSSNNNSNTSHHSDAFYFTDHENDSSSILAQLPAATLANPAAVRLALHEFAPQRPLPEHTPVALEFPVVVVMEEEEERDTLRDETDHAHPQQQQHQQQSQFDTGTLSIYSLWQYHQQQSQSQQHKNDPAQKSTIMSETEYNLSRLNHEIAVLQQELQSPSSRPIDDIQNDLRHKQAERRRWRRKQWFGI